MGRHQLRWGDYYENGQVKPDSPTGRRIAEMYAELDRESNRLLGCEPVGRGYRMIQDADGYPMPIYDAPPIRA